MRPTAVPWYGYSSSTACSSFPVPLSVALRVGRLGPGLSAHILMYNWFALLIRVIVVIVLYIPQVYARVKRR